MILRSIAEFFRSIYTDPIHALNNAWAILLVILGIGFVIFVHELGHFLVAKWAGVKVEMFSLGFGPTLVSWRKGFGMRRGSTVRQYAAQLAAAKDEAIREELLQKYGETEYSIRALPLGGFVKMLGEDPGDESIASRDPRAFHNKPVGARMAIITAGVVMNMIFGVICATWIHMAGQPYMPAVIGYVAAGQPAYEAGLRPGDEVVAIDGRGDVTFQDITRATQLSRAKQKIRFDVKRAGYDKPIPLEIEPKLTGNAPTVAVGVGPSSSLELAPKAPEGLVSDKDHYDLIKAAGPVGTKPTPVSSAHELNAILSRERARPLRVVAERGAADDREHKPTSSVEATLPPKLFADLGLRMTLGPVVAIRRDSAASRAGFQVGDRIVSVDGETDFDPMHLPDLVADRAGKPISVEVRRGEPKAPLVRLSITPEEAPIWTERSVLAEPLEIPGLGLAVAIEPRVAAVAAGSPAAKAGLAAGAEVKTIRFSHEEDGARIWGKAAVPIDGLTASWPGVFDAMQDVDGPVRLEVSGKSAPVELTPAPAPGWFDPMHGLRFGDLFRVHDPEPFGVALRKGSRDAVEMATSIYGLLRNLISRRVSTDGVGGPIQIGNIAFKIAKTGDMKSFLGFLGLLSINLAVMNFFPIPPLDGGQMVFLIAEKVRGRPLPENAVAYPMIIGIALILILFVVISLKDVLSLF